MASTSRPRDIGRKYRSGAQKRAMKVSKEMSLKKQEGALEKLFAKKQRKEDVEGTESGTSSLLNTENDDEYKDTDKELHKSVVVLAAAMANNPDPEMRNEHADCDTKSDEQGIVQQGRNVCGVSGTSQSKSDHLMIIDDESHNTPEETREKQQEQVIFQNSVSGDSATVCKDFFLNFEDPVYWPEHLQVHERDFLVTKGPYTIPKDFAFPKDKKSGRSFSNSYFTRILPNGEKVYRQWLIYSKSADAIFCFCCKLFSNSKISFTSADGFCDWVNASGRLSEHEKSSSHLKAVLQWVELENTMKQKCTIDHLHQQRINEEKARWRNVFERLFAIIQYLSEHNLAFRGSVDKLFKPHNGNFLGLIELIAKFDPVMKEHVRRVIDSEIHDHYLGKRIQNELLTIMGNKVRTTIIERIKYAKYYSVILDCTPDVSHEEQMSLIIRYVSDGSCPFAPVGIYEHFINFLTVQKSTGKQLLEILLEELKFQGLDFMNIRGQGYDNGANMKGKNAGVQSRLLVMNSRAFFTPCACHNYNLLLGDMAKRCVEGKTFFGIVQRLYEIFSASTARWAICAEFVKDLSPKPLSDTRWECRYQSVKSIRYQAGAFYDALYALAQRTNDPIVYSEAESLSKELTNFKFLVALIFWHDILFRVNDVSKQLQGESVDLIVAGQSLDGLCAWLKTYRINGFVSAEIDAKEIANELEVEPVYQEKRIRRRKRMSSDETVDELVTTARENLRVNFFNVVIDQAIVSLKERFRQVKTHLDRFGFLSKYRLLERTELQKECKRLEEILTQGESKDIDGYMLAEEIVILKAFLPEETIDDPLKTLQFLSLHSRSADFPNFWVALRILLTIPVTVASAERSFSKLKLIKTFLRSTMSEDRLNELAIISIENQISSQLDYNELIDTFASLKARKISL